MTTNQKLQFTHPKDPGSGRFLCNNEYPMPANAPGRWAHSNVQEIDNRDPTDDEGMRLECQNCRHQWTSEVAE